MMWWNGGWGWGMWLVMTLTMLLFWGLVAWVVILAVRGAGRWSRPETAEDILAERYARGELTDEEYEAKRARLRHR